MINLGTGTDTVIIGGATESVVGGGGTALVQASSDLAGAAINGGTGKTTLEITTGGTVSLNAADHNLTVQLDAATNLSLNPLAFVSAIGSSGADTITAAAANQTLTGGLGADTLVGYSGFGDTFTDTAAGLTTDTIKTFGGSDVIDITNLNFAIATPLAYSGTTTAGALTATDGTNTATINFTGNYNHRKLQTRRRYPWRLTHNLREPLTQGAAVC